NVRRMPPPLRSSRRRGKSPRSGFVVAPPEYAWQELFGEKKREGNRYGNAALKGCPPRALANPTKLTHFRQYRGFLCRQCPIVNPQIVHSPLIVELIEGAGAAHGEGVGGADFGVDVFGNAADGAIDVDRAGPVARLAGAGEADVIPLPGLQLRLRDA